MHTMLFHYVCECPADQSALTEASIQVWNDAVHKHRDEPQGKLQKLVQIYEAVQQSRRH